MPKNDLVERYVYAIARQLPKQTREDVALELRGQIEDTLAERVTDRVVESKDIRVVLTELGHPDKMAARYIGKEQQALIGLPTYGTYKKVLQIVLAAVGGALLLAWLIETLASGGANLWSGLLTRLTGLFNALLMAFAWVTIIFAIIHHKGVQMDEDEDFIDSLPELPDHDKSISRWDPIVGIVFALVLLVVLVVNAKWNIPVRVNGNTWLPFFNADVLAAFRVPFLIEIGLMVIKEGVRLMDRSHTLRVLAATVVSNIATGIVSTLWLSQSKVINADLLKVMETALQTEGDALSLSKIVPQLLIGIILVSAVVDIASCIQKTARK